MLRLILFILALFITGFLVVQGGWDVTIIAFGYEITTSIVLIVVAFLLVAYLVSLIKKPFSFLFGIKSRLSLSAQHKKDVFITNLLTAVLDKNNAKMDALLKQKKSFYAKNSQDDLLIKALLDPSEVIFDELTKNTQTELAGIRGLFLLAMEKGDLQYAHRLMLKAYDIYPKVYWVMHELLSLDLLQNDYEHALLMVDKLNREKQLIKADYNLYLSQLLFKTNHIKKAYYLDKTNPEFAMAYASENPNKTGDIMATAWGENPSILLYQFYKEFVKDLPASKQIKAIQKMIKKNPAHKLSLYALADISLEAKLYNQAKETLEVYFNTYPVTEKTALLMAKIIREGWHHESEATSWEEKASDLADK